MCQWRLTRTFLLYLLIVPSAFAEDAEKPLAFDVATIKPADPSGGKMLMMGFMQSPDGIDGQNVTVFMMIQFAYGPRVYRMEDQVIGLPSWAKTERYNVLAKISDADIAELQKLAPEDRQKHLGLMLQTLLAERFGLKLHHGTKQAPDYELVVSKGALKIKPATDVAEPPVKGKDDQPLKGSLITFNSGKLIAQQTTLEALAGMLSQSQDVGRPVVDKTGLTGKYNFTLNWSPVFSMPGGMKSLPQSEDAPSVFTALEDDLGLKLVPSTGTEETLIIDQLQKPTAN